MYKRLNVKYPYACQILIKLELLQQIFEKSSNIKFHENPSSGSRIVPCGRTDRLLAMTKLVVAFHSFSSAPKMICYNNKVLEEKYFLKLSLT
jgi:hypothetical protein